MSPNDNSPRKDQQNDQQKNKPVKSLGSVNDSYNIVFYSNKKNTEKNKKIFLRHPLIIQI